VSNLKTERLINLTLALLASSRYLKKNEIFSKVAGYSGSADAMERMFERDKDDLRNLGIIIEVASHDPLFEDETGYRIHRESFQLPADHFTHEEIAFLSTALSLWLNSSLSDSATAAARKISSIAADQPDLPPSINISSEMDDQKLALIVDALSKRARILFQYQGSLETGFKQRLVHPMGITSWKGSWYLIGEDSEKNEMRVFKLSRMERDSLVLEGSNLFTIPESFEVSDYLSVLRTETFIVSALLKKGELPLLRNRALTIESYDTDWDRVALEFDSQSNALTEFLFHCECLIALEPESLRSDVLAALEKVPQDRE
jgi:proteasome accessory factor B